MKKELNIISEIFRMREIMGVGTLSYSSKKYIKEQTNDMSKYLLTEATVQPDPAVMARLFKVLGMDDATAVIFGRSIADNWDAGAKGLIELLEKNGLDDITKLQGKIAAIRGIDVSTVTKEMVDDAMAKFFKNNTDVAEEILKSNSDFVKNTLAGKSFADLLRTVDAQLGAEIDTFVRNTDITSANAGWQKWDLTDLADKFKNSGLDMNDAANKEFADLLDSYAKTADSLDGSSTKIKEPTPNAVTIPKEEMGSGRTRQEQQIIDDAAAEQKRLDDEARQRAENEAGDSQRTQALKDEHLDDILPTLKSDPSYKEAFSIISRFFAMLKLGPANEFLERAYKKFGNMSLSELENFQTSATFKTLTDELKLKAQGRNAKVGKGLEKTTIRMNAFNKFMNAIDNFVKNIPIVGRWAYALTSLYLMWKATQYFEILNVASEYLWLTVKEFAPDLMVSDPRTTLPDCLKYINGYWDLSMDVRDKINLLGLTCDNVKQEDLANFASNIVFVKGGSKMDNTGNKVTTKDKFVVTIGGKEVPFEIGGEITTGGTYTNDPAGYKKYVEEVKKGVYGPSGTYTWEDGAPFYKDSDGKWQAGSYDETKKTFITN